MADTPFDRFIDFVECKQQHTALSGKYNTLQNKRDALEAEITERQKVLDEEHSEVEALKREVHLVELEGKSLRDREQEIRRRLPQVSNQKEYIALTKEVDEIERVEDTNENRLLSLFETAEQREVELSKHTSTFKACLNEQTKQHSELIMQCDRVQKEIVEKQETCVALEKLVEAEQLSEYKRMAATLDSPVVLVDADHCLACRFRVANKDLVQLRRQILVQCKNCYRMLYQRKK